MSSLKTPAKVAAAASFLCVWIPQFPAWALAQNEPALSKRPFVVCERGQVVAASEIALKAGIKLGMSSSRAQSCCAEVLVVGRDHAQENLAWAEMQRALYSLTTQIEPIEPGLLFADVDAKKALPLITRWNAQAGHGSDRASARLMALTAAGGEVRCLRSGREAAFADRVPLDILALTGISARSLERLKGLGWHHVGALRVLSSSQLQTHVGAEADRLFRFAQGGHCTDNLRPVADWTPPEEVTTQLSLEWPAREAYQWEAVLDELLNRVCAELGQRSAQSLELIVQTPIAPMSARRVLHAPTTQAPMLERPARSALAEALQMLAPLPSVVLGLEVRLGHLSASSTQTDKKPSRTNRLKSAFERVEMRFASRNERPVVQEVESPFPEVDYNWLPALEIVAHQKVVG